MTVIQGPGRLGEMGNGLGTWRDGGANPIGVRSAVEGGSEDMKGQGLAR
jgi:hypothetical protein